MEWLSDGQKREMYENHSHKKTYTFMDLHNNLQLSSDGLPALHFSSNFRYGKCMDRTVGCMDGLVIG